MAINVKSKKVKSIKRVNFSAILKAPDTAVNLFEICKYSSAFRNCLHHDVDHLSSLNNLASRKYTAN